MCDTFWCDPLECPFPQASGTSLAQHLWLFFGGAQDGIAQQKHLLNLQGIHAPCWDGDSGAIVLTCPICPSSVDSHATVLRGPRWAGVGAACPAMPSMAQQLEGGGWFWFFDYKGHQGAPRGTKGHLKSQTLQVMRFWWPQKSSKLKLDMQKKSKSSRNKELTTCWWKSKKKNIKTLQNCRCQAKQSTAYFFIRQVPTLSTRVSKAPFCKAFLGVPQGQHDCDTGCSRLGTPKLIFRNQNVRVIRVIIYISINYIYLSIISDVYIKIFLNFGAKNLQLTPLDLATGRLGKLLLLQGNHQTSAVPRRCAPLRSGADGHRSGPGARPMCRTNFKRISLAACRNWCRTDVETVETMPELLGIDVNWLKKPGNASSNWSISKSQWHLRTNGI